VSHFKWKDKKLYLYCHLQPRATRDEITGLHGNRLKIRITAPPADGRANAHLIKFLAKQFGVAKSQVAIESGAISRQKTVMISDPVRLPKQANISLQQE